MKYVSIILATMILLATFPVAAQDTLPAQMHDIPAEGYFSANDTYINTDMWTEYRMQVPRGHEINYDFEIVGQGDFSIYIIPHIGAQYLLQGSYYISYSSAEPVTSFSRTFPADYGFDYEYTIVINSTANITYSADISINEVDKSDYTIYYVLIVLGIVGIFAFSWIIVNRQEQEKKQAEQAAKDSRKSSRGKRRR